MSTNEIEPPLRNGGFCVKYDVRNSPGLGLGLFAVERIPINTLIWKFGKNKNVRTFDDEAAVRMHLAELAPEQRFAFMSHVYMDNMKVHEILDDGELWNHGDNPNCGSGYCGDIESTYALRDIEPGEELIDNYASYDYPGWFLNLYDEYKVPYDFIPIKKVSEKKNCSAESSGFQIDYEIKESSPELGQGVFTKQFIPKGQLVWKYKRGVNVLSYSGYDEVKNRLSNLSPEEQSFLISHIYLYDGFANEITDDGCYINHSESPNLGYGSEGDWQSSYASRDIVAGEELLDDYGQYEYTDWYVRLAAEYGVPLDFVTRKDATRPGFHISYLIKETTHGVGIFAAQRIPSRSLIWKYRRDANVRVFADPSSVTTHLQSLAQDTRSHWLKFLYVCGGLVHDILDDGRLINHSGEPNCSYGIDGDWDSVFASRDIEPDEEICEN